MIHGAGKKGFFFLLFVANGILKISDRMDRTIQSINKRRWIYGFVFYAYLIVDMPYNFTLVKIRVSMLLILIKCVNLLILCLPTNLLILYTLPNNKRKIIKEQVNGFELVNCDFSVLHVIYDGLDTHT